MATIHDVTQHIVDRFDEPITTMKLQKLVYIAQGWSLATLDKPLFDDDFKAWTFGPVATALYSKHRGQFTVGSWRHGDKTELDAVEQAVVDGVVNNYGALSGQQLSDLSHIPGGPWDLARRREGAENGARGYTTIATEDMKTHFRHVLGLQNSML